MLTISQLAAYAGVTVRAVRHYHAKGLLPEPERDRQPRRQTARRDIERRPLRHPLGCGAQKIRQPAGPCASR